MLTRTAAKVARNPERLRNPSFQQHNNAQLLSSRNAKTRMLSFSGSRKHFTGSSFPTKRNEKKKETGCSPRTAAKVARTAAKPCVPARNAKTRMLSFSGSIKHFTGSDFPTKRTNETNQRNEPMKRTNETNQRENAHPNGCETLVFSNTTMLSFSAQETQKHGCSASQVQENTSQVQVFQRNETSIIVKVKVDNCFCILINFGRFEETTCS